MSKLGEYIANTKLDGDNTKSQIEDHHDKYIPRRFNPLEPQQMNETFVLEDRTIGTAFILGHSTNAILGTSTLGAGTLGSWSTVETLTFSDSVQTTGRELTADRLIGDVSTNPAVSYLAVGTGTTAWTLADTALETETGLRVTTTNTWDGSNNEIEFQGTIPSTHPTGTLGEVGFLNNSSGTKLFSRKTITPYVFDGTKELRVTNEVEIVDR